MGFQSGINAMLGTVAGAAFGIKKTLQDRQEEANKKVEQQQEAKTQQKQRFRKSILLDKTGQNIMVPIQQQQPQQKPAPTTMPAQNENKSKSILLGADGRNLTNGTSK